MKSLKGVPPVSATRRISNLSAAVIARLETVCSREERSIGIAPASRNSYAAVPITFVNHQGSTTLGENTPTKHI